MLDIPYDKIIIKKREAEKFFNVSQSQLSKWIRASDIQNIKGYINIYELFVFWRNNIHGVEKLEANKDESENDQPLAELKRKTQAEILRARKLENDKEESKLVSKEDVLEAWCERLSDLRGGLLSLSRRVSHKVAGREEQEAMKIIQDEIDDLFRNFSREGKFCNTPAKKGQ